MQNFDMCLSFLGLLLYMQKYKTKPSGSSENIDKHWGLEITFLIANLRFPGRYEWEKIYLVMLSDISCSQLDDV